MHDRLVLFDQMTSNLIYSMLLQEVFERNQITDKTDKISVH